MDRKEAMNTLGLSDDMAENIKKAYLRLSRENHPDKGGDPETFKKIHAAYAILAEIEVPEPNRQEVLHLHVQVSLEEAVFGVVIETHIRPSVISSRPMIGTNKSTADARVITVVENIPAMALLMLESMTFSHKNQILDGSERTINITYSIREHERYKPHNNKQIGLLEVEEKIPVTTALYGGTIEVETLYGIRKLYVRPGTDVGSLHEIKNHGKLGSLMVRISGMNMPIIHDLDSGKMEERILKDIELEEAELERNRTIATSKDTSS
jgi:DnaJ-class molecular chaperone